MSLYYDNNNIIIILHVLYAPGINTEHAIQEHSALTITHNNILLPQHM